MTNATTIQKPELIASFSNDEYGVRSDIYKTASGYGVYLWDTDADERVSSTRFYDNEPAAIAYAKTLVST